MHQAKCIDEQSRVMAIISTIWFPNGGDFARLVPVFIHNYLADNPKSQGIAVYRITILEVYKFVFKA